LPEKNPVPSKPILPTHLIIISRIEK
jgi:hypothetical protein